MGSSTNRAMKAKAKKARAQAAALAAVEYSKPAWSGHTTIGAANAQRVAVADMVAAFMANGGVVKKLDAGAYRNWNYPRGNCTMGAKQPSVMSPASMAAPTLIVGALHRNAGRALTAPARLIRDGKVVR